MKKKSIIKMLIDILMLILILLEYSKLYTGQLIHEVAGIVLFVLFITHNLLNINFYKGLLKGKYNFSRIIIITIDLLFLFCMIITIVLGIPISEKVFKFLSLNGNMTTRTLHTILGYWDLILLSIHLGLHFKIIFAKLTNKIKDKKILKMLLYIIQLVVVLCGIKAMNDINLGLYLIGKASFATQTNIISSILKKSSIILSIAIITYNFDRMFFMKKRRNKSE